MPPRTLLIDIENSPIEAEIWDLWPKAVCITQIRQAPRILCFAYKWLGEPRNGFHSEWTDTHPGMIHQAHSVLSSADVVVHYNGESFDTPHFNREFLEAGFGPPSPYRQVDLYKAVKRTFRFPSNKLEYVSRALGYEGKEHHEGHALWTKVLNGDMQARRTMERYNRRDVEALEELYYRLLPWMPNLPNPGLYEGKTDGCPYCGAVVQKRGWAYTRQSRFQRYWCPNCLGWSQDTKRDLGITVRSVAK